MYSDPQGLGQAFPSEGSVVKPGWPNPEKVGMSEPGTEAKQCFRKVVVPRAETKRGCFCRMEMDLGDEGLGWDWKGPKIK